MKKISKSGFSFLELAIASAIIGILAIVILSGDRIFSQSKLQSAQKLTKSSSITSIPGLRLWLEPSLNDSITGNQAGTNLSDGELVASWNDISGNNIDVSQEINNRQPQFIASAINGLPAIRFDGVDDVLTNNSGAISNGNNNYTMIAVWQKNAAGGESVIFTQDSNGCENGSGAGIMANNNSIGSYGCGADFNYYPTTLSLEENSPHISIVRVDKSQTNPTTIYLDGLRQASEASLIGGLNASIIGVGGSPNNGLNFNGDIAEIIVFDRALSPAELSAANKYLSKKHLGVNQEIRGQFFCTIKNGTNIRKDNILSNSIYQGPDADFNQGQPIATLACVDATFLPISGNQYPTINCNGDGSWGALIDDCALACTNVAGGLAGSNSQDNGTSGFTAQGDLASITCKAGHSPTNGSPTMSCGSDGIWSSVNNDCTIDCNADGFSAILANSNSSGTASTYSQGSEVSLSCNIGYSGTGKTTICGDGGNWSAPTPCAQQCNVSTLAAALSGSNASNNGTQNYTNQGGSATTTCNSGYSGGIGITCGENGAWNNFTGSCIPQCTLASLNTKLSTTNTQNLSTPTYTKLGAAASIQCKTGFSQTFNSSLTASITCGANGNWNNVVNDCKQNCSIYNGQPFGNSKYYRGSGSVQQGWSDYSACNPGYLQKIKPDHTRQGAQPKVTCGPGGNLSFIDDCQAIRDCWPREHMGYWNISGATSISTYHQCCSLACVAWCCGCTCGNSSWSSTIDFYSWINNYWFSHNTTITQYKESSQAYCAWNAYTMWSTFTARVYCYDGTKYTNM
jgi:prepilin-type N-terminal cleavage/methylation domain-containing protein